MGRPAHRGLRAPVPACGAGDTPLNRTLPWGLLLLEVFPWLCSGRVEELPQSRAAFPIPRGENGAPCAAKSCANGSIRHNGKALGLARTRPGRARFYLSDPYSTSLQTCQRSLGARWRPKAACLPACGVQRPRRPSTLTVASSATLHRFTFPLIHSLMRVGMEGATSTASWGQTSAQQ